MRWSEVMSLVAVLCSCMSLPSTPGEPEDVRTGRIGRCDVADAGDATEGVSDSAEVLEPAPCLEAHPAMLQFGAVACDEFKTQLLTLRSCGDVPVSITDVALLEGSHDAFELDLAALVYTPTPGAPLVLMPGAEVTIALGLQFVPPTIAPDGSPIPQTASVLVSSDSPDSPLEVPALGVGAITLCPVAVIEIAEGDEALTGATLHLNGSQSHSGCDHAAIEQWQWEVDAPTGAVGKFEPSPADSTPTFKAEVVGIYTFSLTVYDTFGVPSCFPDIATVVVIGDESIRVELLWHTPGAPVEADEFCKADVDLHFLHPLTDEPWNGWEGPSEGWFIKPWDCYWGNPTPDWGEPGPAEDPELNHSSDGCDLESAHLKWPEETSYRIGAHVGDDHGFGPSFATVRIFIYSQLVFEHGEVELQHGDMWEMGTVTWPPGKIHFLKDDESNPLVYPVTGP